MNLVANTHTTNETDQKPSMLFHEITINSMVDFDGKINMESFAIYSGVWNVMN